MPVFDYDGQRFRIAAEEVFDDQKKSVGFLPATSFRLLVQGHAAGTDHYRSEWGYVPGPTYPKAEQALNVAMEFIKLNWEARKANHRPQNGDKIGHVPSGRVGKIIPPTEAVTTGSLHVEFDAGKVEIVPVAELVSVP
jgi:hypothetical protein